MGLILLLLCFSKADVDRCKTGLLLLEQEQNSPLHNQPSQAQNGMTQCTKSRGPCWNPSGYSLTPCPLQRTARIQLRGCDGIHSEQSSVKNEALCILMEKHTRSCEVAMNKLLPGGIALVVALLYRPVSHCWDCCMPN